MRIKAIETAYNGYRFRSRLEARWAVFLDTLGIPYEYEKEGFDLDGLAYLPDFWLPDSKQWLEIKPEEPAFDSEEVEKVRRLVALGKADASIVWGLPDEDQYGLISCIGFTFYDFDEEDLVNIRKAPEEFSTTLGDYAKWGGTLIRADALTYGELFGLRLPWEQGIAAARSARFEHGERPRINR
jgi:hypothetical protein